MCWISCSGIKGEMHVKSRLVKIAAWLKKEWLNCPRIYGLHKKAGM